MATASEQQVTTTTANADGTQTVTQSPFEAAAEAEAETEEIEAEAAEAEAEGDEKETVKAEEKPAPKKDKKPWYQIRIDELTAKFKTSETEKAALKAALEAKRKADGEAEEEAPETPQTDVDALATTKAQQIVAVNKFNKKCDEIYDSGTAEFTDWKDVMANYKALGGLNQTIVEAVLELDNPHRILHALAQDMDEAARIMDLPPVKMAVAIAKIQGTEPKQKKISKLPPPINTVTPKNVGEKSPEEMTAQEYDAWAQERRKRKRGW